MSDSQADLDALIQEKLDSDTEFQASLEALTDEEKATNLSAKRNELIKQEFDSVSQAAKKNKELADNYKIRAEKAEKGTPKKAEVQPEPKDGLSSYDTIALIDSKVTVKEDIDEVMDYAKLKGISVGEALKSSVVKTILKEKSEQRATAQATSTGPGKRVTTKVSDESLLDKASKGELPESDEDMARLAEARMAQKKNKK